MEIRRLLAIVALLLAFLSMFATLGVPLLAIAVCLIALIHLVR